MTVIVRPAPELNRIAMAWLRETFPAELGTQPPYGTLLVRGETPPDVRKLLDSTGYFVRVGQLPGRTSKTEITAPLDFDVFALTAADAGGLAREIDALLVRGYLRVSTGASLHNVINQLSPATVPWADAAVRRVYSSYSVTARR